MQRAAGPWNLPRIFFVRLHTPLQNYTQTVAVLGPICFPQRRKHYAAHDPTSPLISGVIEDEDVVKDRVVKSCKDCQMNLF